MTINREAANIATADPTRRASTRATAAGAIGNLIEWYDYGLYGIVAGLVIAPVFFPNASPAVGLLATFATFAVGFAARPLGGIVLGALGDRLGRRPVLILTLIMIGSSTTLLGLLPGYAAIGIWAPILLVFLRLAQGFGAGAELAAAITFVNESSQRKKKGFYTALALATSLLGTVFAIAFFTVLSSILSPEAFHAWGWRVPFLFGGVLTLVGLVLRNRLNESPEFEAVQEARRIGTLGAAKRNPLTALAVAFRGSPRNFLAGFLLPSGLNITGFVAQAFGISYLSTQIGLPQSQTLVVQLVMICVGIVACILFGALADRIGARLVLLIGIIGGALWAFPYFLLLQTGQLGLAITASVVMWALGWSASSAGQVVLLPALFRPQYRSSGLSSARELQGAIVAGPAPLIAVALVTAAAGQPWLVACFIILGHLLTLVAVIIGRPFISRAESTGTPSLRGIAVRE